jgi:hypothetical protein
VTREPIGSKSLNAKLSVLLPDPDSPVIPIPLPAGRTKLTSDTIRRGAAMHSSNTSTRKLATSRLISTPGTRLTPLSATDLDRR